MDTRLEDVGIPEHAMGHQLEPRIAIPHSHYTTAVAVCVVRQADS